MSISNTDIQKALKIKRILKAFFDSNPISKIEAKELMPNLIKSGVFTVNNQDGLPIREFLRKLYDERHLHLIPQAFFEQKDKNKNWYFIRSDKKIL